MDSDLCFPCNSQIPPAIPNGDDYEVSFLRAEQKPYKGQSKVYLWFRIESYGEWNGQELFMACNLPQGWKWGPSSKFWGAWVLAAGKRPRRRDRMSVSVFRQKLFRARIRKVITTSKQIRRTPAQQYSVIDELLEVVVGAT